MLDFMGNLFSVIAALLGIVVVLLLTYYVSKWYAGKLSPAAGGSGKHIKVIDRVMVGKTGALLLVELAGEQYLLSVSEQGAQILKALEEPVEVPEEPAMPAFSLKGLDFRELMERAGLKKS